MYTAYITLVQIGCGLLGFAYAKYTDFFLGGGGRGCVCVCVCAFAHVHFDPCSIYDDKLQSPAQEAVVQLGLATSLDLLRDSSFTKGQKK